MPIKLPTTRLPFAAVVRSIPLPAFPEMTLRSPVAVPPIVFPVALARLTPSPLLGNGPVPDTLVPIKLPRTSLLDAPA